jgi:hypothetical protein
VVKLFYLAGVHQWMEDGKSETRHDAAYVELADGSKLVLVIFTTGHANEREIIPTLARAIIQNLRLIR